MNGEVFPTFSGIQGIHVLHRTFAYALVLLIPLAAWRARTHPGSRRWLAVAAGLVLAQVLVGIANVLMRVPVEITALHSALAAALICTVGVGLFEVWREQTPRLGSPSA
jgi:heme A synthase